MVGSAAVAKEQEGLGALDRLLAATQAEMDKVNALILKRADSHVEMVPELARYLIEAGGKRLRPMLTVAAALLFGKGTGAQTNYAAAVEFMHNATLLHDDVVDESDLRRGRPAARIIWGNQASVLVGDYLLGQAFLMMVETGKLDALEVLAKAATVIAEGEVFQLSKAGDLAATAADYDQVIRAKTATLFQAAAEVGAMAGGADEAGRIALRDYGMELGLAFQLVDDVLDYRGESGAMGKNTGDDLREGKMTLPVILAYARGDAEERRFWEHAIAGFRTEDEDLAHAVALIRRHDCVAATRERARLYAQRACDALAIFPDGRARQAMVEAARFAVSRGY